VRGVSTRRAEGLVQTLGIESLSKSQASRMGTELDAPLRLTTSAWCTRRVDHRGGDSGIAEDFPQRPNGLVADDDDARSFVARQHELEEPVGASVLEGGCSRPRYRCETPCSTPIARSPAGVTLPRRSLIAFLTGSGAPAGVT
jgi:hypothetical protein